MGGTPKSSTYRRNVHYKPSSYWGCTPICGTPPFEQCSESLSFHEILVGLWGFPVLGLWNHPQYVKGSIIPQLIINQQGWIAATAHMNIPYIALTQALHMVDTSNQSVPEMAIDHIGFLGHRVAPMNNSSPSREKMGTSTTSFTR